ncbi:hypothetical protein [Trinickia sp. EG282A]|uniref:hypothetical protein n=1 Tax=Trinickia sp. EG282A TaxID=3237013 RepID=UPI0034D2A0D2
MLPVATNDDLGAIKLSDDFTMDAESKLHIKGGGTALLLDVVAAYGSPPLDEGHHPDWQPSSVLTVYGRPKLRCVLVVGNGATIVGQNVDPTKQNFAIGDDGTWQCSIQMPGTAKNWLAAVAVAPFYQGSADKNALAMLGVITPVQKMVPFLPMQIPSLDVDYVLSYGYTRAAPCDAISQCQISVFGPANTSVNMGISSGPGVFEKNGQKSITATINSSGWVMVGVKSSDGVTPGAVEVEISDPTGQEESIYVYPSFVSPPKVSGAW